MRRFEVDVDYVVTIVARVLFIITALVPAGIDYCLPSIFHGTSSLTSILDLLHFEALITVHGA